MNTIYYLNITRQLAEELCVLPERIINVKVDTIFDTVDFRLEDGRSFWAKLTKNHKRVRKHSVRGQRY